MFKAFENYPIHAEWAAGRLYRLIVLVTSSDLITLEESLYTPACGAFGTEREIYLG